MGQTKGIEHANHSWRPGFEKTELEAIFVIQIKYNVSGLSRDLACENIKYFPLIFFVIRNVTFKNFYEETNKTLTVRSNSKRPE